MSARAAAGGEQPRGAGAQPTAVAGGAHWARDGRRWLLRLLMVAASLALLELACRFLVCSDLTAGWPLAARLRNPLNFGRPQADDGYWERCFLALPEDQRRDISTYHPQLGWTSDLVRQADFGHVDDVGLAGRRPVLLLGDSFAACVTPREDCFEGLFARTPLAADHALLNYGTGGYGFDQTVLLLERAVEHWQGSRPVVIATLLVDDGIDRCLFSFRSWPKPRLRLQGERLVPERPRVPRVAEHFEERGTAPLSVAWTLARAALDRDRNSPGTAEQELEKQRLAQALLGRLAAGLRERDVPFIVVLVLGQRTIADPLLSGWREPLVIGILESLGVPWTSVRPALLAHATRCGRPLSDYFIPQGTPGEGHLNVLGNTVALQVMLEGLGRFLGIGEGGNLATPPLFEGRGRALEAAALMWMTESGQLASRGLEGPYLVLAPRPGNPAEADCVLDGSVTQLRARVSLQTFPRGEAAAGRLRLLRDGVEVLAAELRSGEPARGFVIDLDGAHELRLSSELHGSSARIAHVVLDSVGFDLHPSARFHPPLR